MGLTLVECQYQYWPFIMELRNDDRVSSGFIQTRKIEWEEQKQYMTDNAKYFRVALLDGEPVGYIGVIDNDIRVCTHPNFQGKGVGKFMVTEMMKIFPHAVAKIKVNNTASLKMFQSCGFEVKYYLLEKEQ